MSWISRKAGALWRSGRQRIERGVQNRVAFFDGAHAYSDYLSVRVGTARFLVSTGDRNIGRALFVKQGRGDMRVLQRCVTTVRALLGEETIAGLTFIDVGANIGTTTIPALLWFPFEGGLALEPEPENFATLRLNLALNGLETRTTAVRAAASNAVGEVRLVVDPSESGKHWVAIDETRLASAAASAAPSTVPSVTLDSLEGEAFRAERVGLLWMDAENHEGQILAGASTLVRRGTPVAFEWNRKLLDSRGDRRGLQEIIGEHYTHFADMRPSDDPGEPAYRLRPAHALGDFARFAGPDRSEHLTDVLALRLTQRQAANVDLARVLKDPSAR